MCSIVSGKNLLLSLKSEGSNLALLSVGFVFRFNISGVRYSILHDSHVSAR